MVLQMPIIQGTLLALLNVINTVDTVRSKCKISQKYILYERHLNLFFFVFKNTYGQALVYVSPFIVASVLTGVWGLQITARMIAPYLPEYKIMPKYFAIQLVLIFCKLQPAVIQLIFFLVNAVNEYQFTTKIMENSEWTMNIASYGFFYNSFN